MGVTVQQPQSWPWSHSSLHHALRLVSASSNFSTQRVPGIVIFVPINSILKINIPVYCPTFCVLMLKKRSKDLLWIVVGYLTDVLDDAKLCSSHANKKSIDLDDIKMAIQFKLDHSYTNPPPRDVCSFNASVTWYNDVAYISLPNAHIDPVFSLCIGNCCRLSVIKLS